MSATGTWKAISSFPSNFVYRKQIKELQKTLKELGTDKGERRSAQDA